MFPLDVHYSRFAGHITLDYKVPVKAFVNPKFDNFPFCHVISNFYPSFTSNLVEVR